MSRAGAKEHLARAFRGTGLSTALLALQRPLLGPFVRAVNYHDVPPARAGDFEAQLRAFARRFDPVGPDELRALQRGRWSSPRPGILLSFDDGLRSHAEVVAPLLERHRFPGWFMVPTDFVDCPTEGQIDFARDHQILVDADAWPDGRIALRWDEVRRLDAGPHTIVCHSSSHQRLGAQLGEAALETEIPRAKRRLERELGHPVECFAWVGGEEDSYSAEAARAIRDAGFQWSFMTNNAPILPGTDPLQLQRSNVEAGFSPALVELVLSGFYDLLYWPKRRRVNRLTAATPA